MARKQITEEDGVHKEWYERSKDLKDLSDLNGFFNELLEDYEHDYGTICHAMAAAAVATVRVMNKQPQGGITGFQASAVQWEIIKKLGAFPLEEGEPARLCTGNDLLYPQSSYRWGTITPETRDWLKKKADEKLQEADHESVHPNVLAHWKKLSSGWEPLPVRES